jgi:hypothetical protein
MPQAPILSFESTAFPVAEGEDEETNPGIFGRSLAEWISSQLKQHGMSTTAVIPEDFGWCVPVADQPGKLYVACSSADEKGTSWQVFAFSEGNVLGRLLGNNKSGEALGNLHRVLREILGENAQVSGLKEEA